MPKEFFKKLVENKNIRTSLRSEIAVWFLIGSIIPFIIIILFSLHYFKKTLDVEFKSRLEKNYNGFEIETNDIISRLKEISLQNAKEEYIIRSARDKDIKNLGKTLDRLLRLESIDEISVYDYDGKFISKAVNRSLKKTGGASNEESDSKLSENLLKQIFDNKSLSVKSIDKDRGLMIDSYNVMVDKLGIVRSTLFIDSRFCIKYKEKTGIDIMIISPDTEISSIKSEAIDSDEFIDIYKDLENGEFHYGESSINNTKHKYLISTLRDGDKLINAGVVLLLSEAKSMKSASGMKRAALIIIPIILIIVVILSIYISKIIINPIDVVLVKLKEISEGKGDLTERIEVVSSNEVGMLASLFNKFMENLQDIMTRINDISSTFESSSHDIVLKTKNVNEGTDSQMESVTSTLSSLEEMNSSTKGIVEAVNELSNSAEKSSSAILETDASIKEMAKNSEVLSSSVESAAMSINEMVASIKQVADHAGVMSMISNETKLSMQEIEGLVTKIEDNANRTVKLSEQSTEDASEGMSSVNETIESINLIKNSVDRGSKVIETLGHRISSIDEILDVIDNVAEQTNLLALNAAIIAAQAGEHGKGFAIVADEIKDLADRTAASTKEIANIIRAVQEESKKAVEVMRDNSENVTKSVNLSREASDTLKKILSNAEQATERVKEIAEATVVQSNRTSEVMKSMIEVTDMSNQISSATKEQNVGGSMILKATESIKDIAYQLKTSVREQTVASKNISSETLNISQMVKQINKAVKIQKEQSDAALIATRTINDKALENQKTINELESVADTLEGKSKVLNDEIGKFKV